MTKRKPRKAPKPAKRKKSRKVYHPRLLPKLRIPHDVRLVRFSSMLEEVSVDEWKTDIR
jgi:hypothetical protein